MSKGSGKVKYSCDWQTIVFFFVFSSYCIADKVAGRGNIEADLTAPAPITERRNTLRSASRRARQTIVQINSEEEMAENMMQRLQAAINRRNLFQNSLQRLNEQVAGEAMQETDLLQAEEVLRHADNNWQKFESRHEDVIALDLNADQMTEQQQIYAAVEVAYYALRRDLRARITELTPVAEQMQQGGQGGPVHVEFATIDALGNIPNTWGTFTGDYSQWHSFRDRFKAAVHENVRLQPIFKFQYLRAAVTGAAARAMGDWQMVEANYQRAWERLCSVYEDDYLAVQTLCRRLRSIPKLERPSHNGLRKIIDTVHECLHQLSTFVAVDGWDPYIVFDVLDRLDPATHDAWESQRPRNGEHRGEDVDMEVAGRRFAQIPTWKELEAFLERRARISIYADNRDESRSRDNSMNRTNKQKRPVTNVAQQQQKPTTSQAASNKQRMPTGYPPCVVCKADHPLYRCVDFLRFDLAGRREVVSKHKLCLGCLKQVAADHNCITIPCPMCPSKPVHNSLLCPSREANRRTNLLTAGDSDMPDVSQANKKSKPNKSANK